MGREFMKTTDARVCRSFAAKIIVILLSMSCPLLAGVDDLFFKDQLQPVQEENSFKTPGYYNWCTSVIRGDEAHLFPLDHLMDMYYKSVGRNSTLIMGLTPNPDGLLPEPDVQRLKAWGDEIGKRLGQPAAVTQGKGTDLTLQFDQDTRFDHVVIQEDIRHGERVRQYTVKILQDSQWHTLASGSCIGHKRIHHVPSQQAQGVRLIVHESTAQPLIKTLAIY